MSQAGGHSVRFANSARLRARAQRFAATAPIPGQWFQFATLALYLSLLYKVLPLGLALLVLLSGSLYRLRKAEWHPSVPIVGLGIAYVGLGSLAAYLVSFNEGASRTVQFTLVVAGGLAIAKYLAAADLETARKFYRRFAWLNAAVLLHIIVYHLTHGKIVTWKYLLDTKFAFSASVVALFYFEDDIRRRSTGTWYALLICLTGIILLSGERKAYLLVAAVFFLSRASITVKATIVAISMAGALAFLAAFPNSYVGKQLSGGSEDTSKIPTRAFLTIRSIADHSDEIRTFVNRNADNLFAEHPIFGVGATGYQAWARQRYGVGSVSGGLSMNVHGERHRVPAENGMVGIIIVLSYLAAIGWRAVAYVANKGWLNSPATARAPLYMITMLVTYAYGEAMDTTMLLLILLTGLTAASIHPPSILKRSPKRVKLRPSAVQARA
jgi:uncharacterized metal-binding protein